MKKLFAILLAVAVLSALCGCGNTESGAELQPVRENGLYGFADKDGKVVITCEYDFAEDFQNGMARVVKGDKWGFVNVQGEDVIPAEYTWVGRFSEDIAAVEVDNLYGYILKTGDMVIEPQFEDAGEFNGGLARAEINGRYGYIGRDGLFIIEPQYLNCDDFSENVAPVCNDEGEWGYIDAQGNVVVNFIYKKAKRLTLGLAAVKVDGKWGYINASGDMVIEPQFDDAEEFKNDEGVTDKMAFVEKNGEKGWIDMEGVWRYNAG